MKILLYIHLLPKRFLGLTAAFFFLVPSSITLDYLLLSRFVYTYYPVYM